MSIDPTLATIADADLEYLRPQLEEIQPEVLEAEGYYLQMLGQPEPLPAQGSVGVPDASATRPSDRATSAEDWGIEYRSTTPVRTAIFETRAHCVMMGGQRTCIENGWSFHQEVMSGGSLWSRNVLGEGPGESTAWVEQASFPPHQ